MKLSSDLSWASQIMDVRGIQEVFLEKVDLLKEGILYREVFLGEEGFR